MKSGKNLASMILFSPINNATNGSKLIIINETIVTFNMRKNTKRSRWWELNPRPIPYQGIAIPLSHSGILFP